MKRLSDRQRRLFCRILLLFGCAMPTLAMTYSLWRLPGGTEWSRQIRTYLGVNFQINSIATPRPGNLVLSQVKWNSDLTPQVVDLGEISVDFGRPNRIEALDTVCLPTGLASELISGLHDRLLLTSTSNEAWEVNLGNLRLECPNSVKDFLNFGPVNIKVGNDASGNAIVSIRLFVQPGTEPVEIEFARNRTTHVDGIFVTTAGKTLPLWFFSEIGIPTATLLKSGKFSGAGRFVDAGSGFSGEFHGTFTDLDLAEISSRTQLQTSGKADLAIHACRLQNGKIHSARGILTTQDAEFSSSGIAILQELLDGQPVDPKGVAVNCQFELDRNLFILRNLKATPAGQATISTQPFSMRVQHVAHLLTSPGFLRDPSPSRSDVAKLTDEGVHLLRALQLAPTDHFAELESSPSDHQR